MGKGVNGNLKSLDEIDPKEAFAIDPKEVKLLLVLKESAKNLRRLY